MIRYAKFEGVKVLDMRGANAQQKNASLSRLSEFDNWRTESNYLYVRIRAISSRINQNFDSWGSIDLAGSPEIFNQHKSSSGGFTIQANKDAQFGFSTFLGKPIFVDHNNSDPKRARGVVVDAKFHVEDHKTAALDPFYSSNEAEDYHLPPSWVELLLEVDAKSFPKFAQAIIDGAKDPKTGIDGFSMGANIRESYCNICNNRAEDESQFCQHIKMKGAPFKAINSRTGKQVMKKAAEKCVGVGFFEISGVFSPADETALTQELIRDIRREGSTKTARNWNKMLKEGVDPGGPYIDTIHQLGIPYPNASSDLHSQPNLPLEIDEEGQWHRPSIHLPCNGRGCPACNWDGEISVPDTAPPNSAGGDGASLPYNVEQFAPDTAKVDWSDYPRRQGAANFMDEQRICPSCRGMLDPEHGMRCTSCGQHFPLQNEGITGLIDENDPTKYQSLPTAVMDTVYDVGRRQGSNMIKKASSKFSWNDIMLPDPRFFGDLLS